MARLSRSHKYLSRAEKRELRAQGIHAPVTIYDAARDLRIAEKTPNRPIRDILKDRVFRSRWDEYKKHQKLVRRQMQRGDVSREDLQESFDRAARSAEMWGWWRYDPDVRRWRYIS